MKRIVSVLLVVVIALFCASCSKAGVSAKHHGMIQGAVSELKDDWKASDRTYDGYFEIKNTRVITVKDNDIEQFSNVAYIIEFELFTDYFGSAPYYENVGIYDDVIVYKDGTMDVSRGLIGEYRSRTYQTDLSNIIEAIDDYQGQYNCVEKLK